MLHMWKKEPDAVGDYKSEAGISVEHAPEVVNLKTLKGREISHILNTCWDVDTVKVWKRLVNLLSFKSQTRSSTNTS